MRTRARLRRMRSISVRSTTGSAFACAWRRSPRSSPLRATRSRVGLSPGRFAALILIDRNPGISQTASRRAIGSDKSTLTPVLDNLVKRGLISRARTRSDRRLYRAHADRCRQKDGARDARMRAAP